MIDLRAFSRWRLGRRRFMVFVFALVLFGLLLAGSSVHRAHAADIGDDFLGAGPVATVGAYRLNVRSGPGIGYPVITVLNRFTPVEMLYRWGSGFWIAIQAPGGVVGWVNATWLNGGFATGALPAWSADPTLLASPAIFPPAAPQAPVVPSPSLVVGDDFMGAGPVATVGAYLLNVRSGPSIGYPVITTIGRHTPVEMLYRWGAGFWIAIQMPDGRIGWVNATWLNGDFATGALPAWTGDPTLLATP